MPRLSKQVCHAPGCYAAADGPYCADHRRYPPGPRPSAAKRGYDRDWQRLRLLVLREQPTCACGAKATDVDHLVSIQRRPELRLVRSNLRAMCKRCHARKTCRVDGGFGNG